MPYIEAGRVDLSPMSQKDARTPGELNFQITMVLKRYVETNGLCYATIADVLSSCEGAKLEFYRRIAAPYEEDKMLANGDVY